MRWKWYESPTYTVTLREALGLRGEQAMGVYYAYVDVYSPAERRARMLAAFADSLRVWWNGKPVLSEHRHPKWTLLRDAWAESRPIDLRRGWNRVLLKIGPSLMTPTAFMFRVTGEDGVTLPDLVYARQVGQVSPPVPLPPTQAPTTVPQGLDSWTDSGLSHYSGAAVYETQFEFTGAARKLMLDLGEVGVAAEVWLNGEHAGARAWRPFRFDITRLVRPHNTLKIRVANSDAGWQSQGDTIYPRGSWGLNFRTERDRLKTLRPNGLEGPVRIIAVE